MGTANHDNVATELGHHKTTSFAIQNQASHVEKSGLIMNICNWADG